MGKIEDLSTRVRRLRKDADLSQSALANLTGLSVQMIKDIEAGRRGGSVDTLGKLASAFGISLQEIASGDPHVKASVIKEPRLKIKDLSKFLTKIPDDIYEKAQDLDPADVVWEDIRGFMEAAIREKKNNKKNGERHA